MRVSYRATLALREEVLSESLRLVPTGSGLHETNTIGCCDDVFDSGNLDRDDDDDDDVVVITVVVGAGGERGVDIFRFGERFVVDRQTEAIEPCGDDACLATYNL